MWPMNLLWEKDRERPNQFKKSFCLTAQLKPGVESSRFSFFRASKLSIVNETSKDEKHPTKPGELAE